MGRVTRRQLRLVLISDGQGDLARLERIVAAAVDNGVRCVQLRERQWTARELCTAAERLLPQLIAVDGRLLVNDRVDVAAALGAGAQIGARSVPADLARRVLGPGASLGFSAHDPGELDLAHAAGCDFALLSPVWPTSSKPGAAALGAARAIALTERARLPVVWLGGVDVGNLDGCRGFTAPPQLCGFAVRSAIMAAADPGASTAALLAAIDRVLPPR